jgi:hypothetical protein
MSPDYVDSCFNKFLKLHEEYGQDMLLVVLRQYDVLGILFRDIPLSRKLYCIMASQFLNYANGYDFDFNDIQVIADFHDMVKHQTTNFSELIEQLKLHPMLKVVEVKQLDALHENLYTSRVHSYVTLRCTY